MKVQSSKSARKNPERKKKILKENKASTRERSLYQLKKYIYLIQ